ncbi:non-ribosomal peptide synthetase [Nitrospirillum viridazoti]|uniref:Non-ribosomal peptide synthetase n=1 Tax=Nitrospirillum viridazoti CBAmc TaxID=1441467 RepID=A0A248K090_9PROT|nr:non-ribosomal peptide synthetase [Nitrospirillum amazonense]ASG24397.1 non-ribosomal peptide synthetase [Nitrospirillum amazonense CBAmc]TWB33354.1 amino acid adenylation domain-containing protein [Nitrospirillum amazonense]
MDGLVNEVERAAPLSHAQERLWLLQRFNPADTAYNLTRAFRLRGPLDVAVLGRALQSVAWRHAILRTRFTEGEGAPVQLIQRAPLLPLVVEEGGDPAARAMAAAARPFDLAAAPPIRAILVRAGPDDHTLILALHHIVSDAASNPILARDLMTAYQGAMADEDKDAARLLPALDLQYADYATAQRGPAAQVRIARAVDGAVALLGGLPPALDLPTDRPRPAAWSGRGARHTFDLPVHLLPVIKAVGGAEGCTPFTLVLAAWQAVLSRWGGQRHFAVGVPFDGREEEEMEELIGFFVDTAVFPADIGAGLTGRTLCRRLRDAARTLIGNGAAPFDQVLARLAPPRDPSRAPVFQTMVNVQMGAPAVVRLAGLAIEAVPVAETTAKVDLALEVAVTADAIHCAIDYATDLFDPVTIAALASAFGTLLAGLLANPDAPLDALPLLDLAGRAHELTTGNDTALDVHPTDDLVVRFEAQARRAPGRTALVFEDAPLSYGDLNARANRLARRLLAQGVGPDIVVGVRLPRGPALVVALLAVLKAGGAYLPLDPDQPAARTDAILAHAGPRLVLDDVPDQDGDDSDLGLSVHPRQLAYRLYTSGSTGVPKGVEIDRQAISSLLRAMALPVAAGPDDRLLAVTTVGFDIAGLELFLPLTAGGTIVLASRAQALDPAALDGLIRDQGVTCMQATPATWRMMLDATDSRWPGLRALCGGEALRGDLARRLLDRGVRLWNVYGPTETTVWSAAHAVTPADGDAPAVAIGGAIANNRLFILDDRLEPMPPGAVGDLWIGGIGLARGYAGQPAVTAAAFAPNPFPDAGFPGGGAGSRIYRTGDRARRRPDGAIEFLGRADHQLKVRGFRIEAAEVEGALEAHAFVRQAAVTAHVPADGEAILCAYLVADGELPDLRPFLAARLPAYMVPTAYVRLDRLPLSASGKLDRRALPPPDAIPPSTAADTAPLRGTAAALAALWAEVLDRPVTRLDADFFLLGGHSLRLVRLQTRIRAAFGREIPLADLFQVPTLSAMTARIDALGAVDEAEDIAFMANLLDTL